MSPFVRFGLWLYGFLLRFYPRRFRDDFGEEMTAVFEAHLLAASESGRALKVLGREIRDWPVNLVREHIWERKRQLLLPRSPFLSGWGVVAAGLPFLIYFLNFGPSMPRYLPIYLLLGGVLVAWWQRWPGWVVSWLGFLIFYGQNWLPYSLFQEEQAWNTGARLLDMLSSVAIQAGWLVVLYFVMRRWPRYGALAFLPVAWTPWAFSMEFASEAMTAVVFSTTFVLTGVIAMAISRQRTASGDIWLMYGGALLAGTLLMLGEHFFTPGGVTLFNLFGPNLIQAVGPFVGIVALYSLNSWSGENGRAARQRTLLMTAGTLLGYMALQALGRLVGPSDLEAFQMPGVPLLAGVWLLGALLIGMSAWGLRHLFKSIGRKYLIAATGVLILLPLFQRPSFLSQTANTLVFTNPSLGTLRDLIPVLETADVVLLNVCILGLLALPFGVGKIRRQTAAFPPTTPPFSVREWWRRRERSGPAKDAPAGPGRSRLRRLALLITFSGLAGGGLFFGAVFLPLQLRAEPYTKQAALGDIDGDGDLDLVLANTMRLLPTVDNEILFNDGNGRFTRSEVSVGMGGTSVVVLDSDGDGDMDLFFGGMIGGVEFNNNGNESFVQQNIPILQMPESGASQIFLQTGDLNGDGFMDVFLAGCCGTGSSRGEGDMEWFAPVNRVLFGSERGLVVDGGQQLGVRGSQAVDLGDLDGDGDLDAFVGNTQSNVETDRNNEPNEVWLNDGQGIFSDSGQLLGGQRTYAVALGDVDGDGDLDVLVGNEGRDELWLNDGDGRFNLSDQSWSRRQTLTVSLIDLDGDGDLDGLTGHQMMSSFAWWRQGIIWWNDGNGRFTEEDQRLRYPPNGSLVVGDVNGDGWPDIVCGALDEAEVWLNDGDGSFSKVAFEN